MNRTDLQTLSEIRIREAKILLDAGCYDGAYYLSGYAVECALKSCIAKQFKEHDFPDRKIVLDSYTHEIEKLFSVSGLDKEFNLARAKSSDLDSNWTIVKDWSEQVRYQHGIEKLKAQDLYDAITQKDIGVLSWIKNWW